MGNLNKLTSRCEEHTPSLVKNAKQHLTENTGCFNVRGRIISDTMHAGQEARVLGKNYPVIDEEDSRNVRDGKP